MSRLRDALAVVGAVLGSLFAIGLLSGLRAKPAR